MTALSLTRLRLFKELIAETFPIFTSVAEFFVVVLFKHIMIGVIEEFLSLRMIIVSNSIDMMR